MSTRVVARRELGVLPSPPSLPPGPYMLVREAADYLHESVDSVRRRLIEATLPPERGKLRYRLLPSPQSAKRVSVRIIADDVYALLPPP